MIEGPFSVLASLCTSLVPRAEEGKEEKGSGFSHSSMCLIITDMSGRVLMMPSKPHGWMHGIGIKLTRVAFYLSALSNSLALFIQRWVELKANLRLLSRSK